MKVKFSLPRGARYEQFPDGLTFDVEMPAVPRVGDGLIWQDDTFQVHAVDWTPYHRGHDAYVVLR